MVLEGDTIGDAVDHLLSLNNLDRLLGQLLFVVATQFQPEVLTHLCKLI